jgi:tetratricopeptide (TPR) repeat protein
MATAADDARAIVATTRLALESVRDRSPAAVQLLSLCSFLAADDVPRQMLFRGADKLPVEAREAMGSAEALLEPIEVLDRYGLLRIRGDAISFHRAIQEAIRDDLTADERAVWATSAASVVLNAFPGRPEDPEHWRWTGRLLPHALMTAEHLKGLDIQLDLAVDVRLHAARYLISQAQVEAAREMIEADLERLEKSGATGALYATALNQLGTAERALGQFNRARLHANRALEIHRAVREMPRQENPLQSTEPAADRVMQTKLAAESALPDDPEIVEDLRNLGYIAHHQGDDREAIDHFAQALMMRRRLYGDEHVLVAESYEDLFGPLAESGRLTDAVGVLRQAVEVEKAGLGALGETGVLNQRMLAVFEHPETAAETAAQILDQSESMYGPRHTGTADACRLLATLLRLLDQLDDSRRMADRALAIDLANFGDKHFRVGAGHIELMLIAATAGDLDDAERALRDGVEVARAAPDDERSNTLRLLRLSDALTRAAALDRARPFIPRAQAILEAAFPEGDPARPRALQDAMTAHLAAGDALLYEGSREEAESYYRRGLELALLTRETAFDDGIFHMRLWLLATLRGDDSAPEHLRESIRCFGDAGVESPVWEFVNHCSSLFPTVDRSPVVRAAVAALIDQAIEGGTVPEFRATLTAAVPDGWFTKESTTLLAPDGQSNVIASGEPLDPSIDVAKYASVQGEALVKDFPDYTERAFDAVEILGDRRGYLREFEWTPEDGTPVTQLQLYYVEDGRGYTATATTPTAGFPERELLLREVLRGLRIAA